MILDAMLARRCTASTSRRRMKGTERYGQDPHHHGLGRVPRLALRRGPQGELRRRRVPREAVQDGRARRRDREGAGAAHEPTAENRSRPRPEKAPRRGASPRTRRATSRRRRTTCARGRDRSACAYRLHFHLGLLYGKQGPDLRGHPGAGDGADINNKHFPALKNLAVLYQKAGFRNKAIETWERAPARRSGRHHPTDHQGAPAACCSSPRGPRVGVGKVALWQIRGLKKSSCSCRCDRPSGSMCRGGPPPAAGSRMKFICDNCQSQVPDRGRQDRGSLRAHEVPAVRAPHSASARASRPGDSGLHDLGDLGVVETASSSAMAILDLLGGPPPEDPFEEGSARAMAVDPRARGAVACAPPRLLRRRLPRRRSRARRRGGGGGAIRN